MPKKISSEQRKAVVELLGRGVDRHTIAVRIGITPGQVSAISAHITMGSYNSDTQSEEDLLTSGHVDSSSSRSTKTRSKILQGLQDKLVENPGCTSFEFSPIPIGQDLETNEVVRWNPNPNQGSANPHVLVIGESGFGKTYSICGLISELAHRKVTSIVFDYGQGFSLDCAPHEFVSHVHPSEIQAGRDGININPLQLFLSDIHGPVNVGQRIADTFQRVYPRLGVQQHAMLRQAVLDVFADAGISAENRNSWNQPIPSFQSLEGLLKRNAEDIDNPRRKQAADLLSHISTVFVFNTFRGSGSSISWVEMVNRGGVFIIQLKGLETSLQRIVTEFLLWNFVGYIESLGPGPLRAFAVLDEAHRLAFDSDSAVDKLLREGRKYGIGLILASQQPEDFGPVAFSNTATKMIFQVSDNRCNISKHLHRKLRNYSLVEIQSLVTKLPRGVAFCVIENLGKIVKIDSFQDRYSTWVG